MVAAGARPDVAANRASVVSLLAATTAVAFVVLGAARDGAVCVND